MEQRAAYNLTDYGRYQALAVLGGQVHAQGRFWQAGSRHFLSPAGPGVWVADGGLDFCLAEGLSPQAVLGDMDSLSPQASLWLESASCPVRRYPRRKDQTDGALALEALCSELPEASRILILAGWGEERQDHHYLHLQLLFQLRQRGYWPVLSNGRNWALPLCGACQVSLPPAEKQAYLVSLIAQGGSLGPLESRGLAYELGGRSLDWGDSLGLSNYPQSGAPAVELRSAGGLGLLICSEDEGSLCY